MTARLDWFGCATFRFDLDGTVVFLDAFLDRFPGAAGTTVVIEEIERADWIVIGHSHFDHLFGAERLARQTGATIIGSYETVRIMEREGVPSEQLMAVSGGERIRLAPGVTVTPFPSLHSAVWAGGLDNPLEACVGDLWLTEDERKARLIDGAPGDRLARLTPEVVAHFTRVNSQHPRGDGGPLLFLFETSEGSLLFQDTSGHWTGVLRDLRPDVAILAAAGRGTIDGEPIQGSVVDFVAREAMLLRPRRLILAHHDDFFPGWCSPLDVPVVAAELKRVLPGAELADIGYATAYPLFEDLRRRTG